MSSPGEIYLMSPPGRQWALRGRANFRSREAEAVEPARAFREWLTLGRAIEAAGGTVWALPADESMTGLPYCAEAGHPVALEDGAPLFLLPRMWAPHRQDEWRHWQRFVETAGIATWRGERGYWEGQGDVATFDGATLLFYGGRTDLGGLDEVREFFTDPLVLEIRQPAFHGNVAVLPVPACDRLVVCPQLITSGYHALEERFGKERLITISEDEARRYATNALPVGTTVIAPSIAPSRVLDELSASGAEIVTLQMQELCEKAGGASRCLVCRVPAALADSLNAPPGASLDDMRSERETV